MISSTSNEMPSLMVHAPSSLEVSPNQFSTHQESEVSRSSTVSKIPITNTWTETNGNTTHTDPEDEEVDVMDITPSNPVNNGTEIVKTSSVQPKTDKVDDTETSSGCDLAESDLSDSEKSKIKKKWNKQKYNVAWRWSWLQLQSTELQHQLKQCDTSVPPPQTISNNATNNNNDTTPQPSTTSTSQSLPSSPSIPKLEKKQSNVQRHPLFPSKDNKKRTALSPDPTTRHKRLKQFESEDSNSSRKTLSRSTSSLLTPNMESPLSSPRLKRGHSRFDKFNIDHIVLPCTPSPGPPVTPKDVPTPKWRDFGNDPFEGYIARSQSMESTSPCGSPSFRRTKSMVDVHLARSLSVEFPKEDTQDLSKSIEPQHSTDISTDVKHETLDSTQNELNQNGLQTALSLSNSTTFSLSQEGAQSDQKREFHLVRSESGSSLASQNGFKSDGSSSEEDTSDEAFMYRHFCRELLERRRLFKGNLHGEGWMCPNDLDELPAVLWQSPEEYFKTKLRCRQQEIRSKLKEKFTRIRTRYVNPCTVMMDWEKQGVEVERIMAQRAHELKQREAALLSSSLHREHREPRVHIIDDDEEQEEEEEQNSYCASSEEEEDFFDQYSESSDASGASHAASDESEDVFEFDEDSDGEYTKHRRRYDMTSSTGRRKGRHKKRQKTKQVQRGRRGRPTQLHQFSPEFGRWEIVRKTPPVDPITNQLRNIIYLRRVREHTQSAD